VSISFSAVATSQPGQLLAGMPSTAHHTASEVFPLAAEGDEAEGMRLGGAALLRCANVLADRPGSPTERCLVEELESVISINQAGGRVFEDTGDVESATGGRG